MISLNKSHSFLCIFTLVCSSFFPSKTSEKQHAEIKILKQEHNGKRPLNPWKFLLRSVEKDPTLQALVIEYAEKKGDAHEAEALGLAKKRFKNNIQRYHLSPNVDARVLAETFFCSGNYEQAAPMYHSMAQNALRDTTNYAETLLGMGNYIDGFKAFDSRLDIPNTRNNNEIQRNILQNPWNGNNPRNKTILVRTECGLGDTFFFARYLATLKATGARVIVSARQPEKTILGRCPYIDKIVDAPHDGKTKNAEDVFLMSLPRYLSKKGLTPTTLETIPYGALEDGAYITSNQMLNGMWNTIVNNVSHSLTALKIGLCWRSSDMPGGHTRILHRDIPLPLVAQISKIKGVHLFNLQCGGQHCPLSQPEFDSLSQEEKTRLTLDEHDIVPEGCHVENFAKYDLKTANPVPVVHDKPFIFDREHGAFADTLALAHQMDFIVSADSSVPSLTAAAGLKTIYLLPKESDWRWLHSSYKTSPWFPTAHLLWQHKQGDWTQPLEELRTIIHQELQRKAL